MRSGRHLLHVALSVLMGASLLGSSPGAAHEEPDSFANVLFPFAPEPAFERGGAGDDPDLAMQVDQQLADRSEGVAAALSGSSRLVPIRHTIGPGESLAAIAEQFGIDVPTLLGSNDLEDPDLIPIGGQLNVLPVRGVLYPVAEGDTLNRIAERYSLVVRDILRANALENSELITPGQQLVLPGAKPLVVAPAPRVEAVQEATWPGPASVARSPAALNAPTNLVEASQRASQPQAVLSDQLASRPAFTWPAGGRITTHFRQVGWTSPRGHAGVDIAAPWGAPIAAVAAGRVLLATRSGGAYGIQIILDHGNGLRTVYGHLSELKIEQGQAVDRGQIIGLVGSTGFSTGPHLHFEVRQNGELRDPLSYLP